MKVSDCKYATQYILYVRHKQGEQNRMTNLLQRNIEKANAQIAHLVFANTQNADHEKPKELFLATTLRIDDII